MQHSCKGIEGDGTAGTRNPRAFRLLSIGYPWHLSHSATHRSCRVRKYARWRNSPGLKCIEVLGIIQDRELVGSGERALLKAGILGPSWQVEIAAVMVLTENT